MVHDGAVRKLELMLHSAKLPGVACLLLLLISTSLQALPRPNLERITRGFGLRPGVVVDPELTVVYTSHPDGGIEALDLASGQPLWSTRQAAIPLLLHGELLIARAEPAPADDALRITVLDTNRQTVLFSSRLELPTGVRAAVDDSLGHSFVARATVVQGDVIVFWTDSRRTVSALPEAAPAEGARETSGAAQLDLEAELLRPLTASDLPTLAPSSPDLPTGQRLAGLAGVQFLAADGHHVAISRRVADDRVVEKYEWTVYSYPLGRTLGKAPARASHTPFGVVGTSLLHESRPAIQRLDGRLVVEPLGLRMIDLARGVAIWRRPIRDTTYRGPLPP